MLRLSIAHYTIGLSILSNNDTAKARQKSLASAEARRILSLLEGQPINENDITREPQGRPFFPGRDIDFNIAHSGLLVAVAHIRGKNLRTACDIEYVRPRAGMSEVTERFFSAHETKYLYPRGKFNQVRFFQIWTLKECFLKLRGLSVFDMTAAPSFINGKEQRFTYNTPSPSPLSFRLYELSDNSGERYLLATAIEGAVQTQPEIQWFSQSAFGCKMIAEIKAAPKPPETMSPKK